MFRILGLEEIKRNFAKYPVKVVKSMFNAMQISCNMVVDSAKEIVPVDTGRLRNSLDFDVKISKDSIIGEIGTNIFYAPYIEFGTSRTKAQPYLRPSFTKNIQRILGIFRDAIKRTK